MKKANCTKANVKSCILKRLKEHQEGISISRKYISSINEDELKIRIKELKAVLKYCV